MTTKINENAIRLFEKSFIDNWELPALSDYGVADSTLTYGDLAEAMARVHIFFEHCGIKPGDHIALVGKNTPAWVTVFMATITYGAVIVPILQDFNPVDMQHIVNHSESVLLFTTRSIWDAIDFDQLPRVRAVLRRGLPVTEGVDFDGLTIDEPNRVAKLRGRAVDLTAGEFSLLVRLVAHRGRVFPRPADERTVDVQVANLRRKLGRWGDHIETVRGVGYRVSE